MEHAARITRHFHPVLQGISREGAGMRCLGAESATAANGPGASAPSETTQEPRMGPLLRFQNSPELEKMYLARHARFSTLQDAVWACTSAAWAGLFMIQASVRS